MDIEISNRILDSLRSMFWQDGNHNPRHAHRNLCHEMCIVWYRMRVVGQENGISQDENGIRLLRPNEKDFMVKAIPFEAVRDVFSLFRRRSITIDVLLEAVLSRLQTIPMSLLRKWAFTCIWASIEDELEVEATHPFNQFDVFVGAERAIFVLKNAKAHLVLEFYRIPNGCQIVYNGHPETLDGFEFEDLAANEFIEIIKFSRGPNPRKVLAKFSIDFDPFRRNEEKNEWELGKVAPNPLIFQKIRRWMNVQRFRFPAIRIHAHDFFLRWFLFENDEAQLFNLDYLQPEDLTFICLRSWDHERRSQLEIHPEQLHIAQMTNSRQWTHARRADINDPALKGYTPNLTRFNYVVMWCLTKKQLWELVMHFRETPPPDPTNVCVIKSLIHFAPPDKVNYYFELRDHERRFLSVTVSPTEIVFAVNDNFFCGRVLDVYSRNFQELIKE